MKNAQVYLIGAGPGSLELLTIGAVRAIGLADALAGSSGASVSAG